MMATQIQEGKDRPLVQTVDMLSESQQKAIRKIAAHDEARIPTLDETRPVSIFTGQERFDAEQRDIFQKRAVPLTVSARLKPGTAVAHDSYGKALIITRDKAGEAHVFLNACMHKGAKLIDDPNRVKGERSSDGCPVQAMGRMTCPYHAWSYGLNGKLLAAARPETFANLDKSTRGLKELACKDAG